MTTPMPTHGARITVAVRRLPARVALSCLKAARRRHRHLPGLGLEVGGPAITPAAATSPPTSPPGAAILHAGDGLAVRISCPEAKRWRKTLNARLGILGGISILGTTGIVRSFSTAAWRASAWCRAIEVAAAQGRPRWC